MPDGPRTRATLAADLTALGVRSDETVLVHSSLRRLGWVCGGAVAAVQAPLDVLGSAGTLVVPTRSTGRTRSCPSRGCRPSVLVRQWPGAVRNNHPHASFAAVGRRAAELAKGVRRGGADRAGDRE